MTGAIVVVGDVLLDRDVSGVADRLCPDAPVPVLTELSAVQRAGGAGLAASFLARDGADVTLVCAVGADEAGEQVRRLLDRAGITLVEIPYDGPTTEKIRLRAGTHPLLRLDRGVGAGRFGPVPPGIGAAVRGAAAVLVSDYGGGVTALSALRRMLTDAAARVPTVWDPHPRGATPVPGVRLATPNRDEAATFAAALGAGTGTSPSGGTADGLLADPHGRVVDGAGRAAAEARLLRSAWRSVAVAVTLGPHGAVVADAEAEPTMLPAPVTHRGDTCGAGDRFAATAAHALASGAGARDAVAAAVDAASRYVASDGPARLSFDLATLEATS
jgi:bifunctional ADP-heptose synthase (sugar kinase/adenylyltransferase)